MKNKLSLAVLCVLFAAGTLVSQTPEKFDANNPKANFIKEQSYLSKSSLKDYKGYYGDSLKGFNEAALQAKYLEKGLYGTEFLYAMNAERRLFIDSKYKLGVYAQSYKPADFGSVMKPIGGGGNGVNVLPCVNEDFEATTPGQYATTNGITGWTVVSAFNNISWGGINCNPQAPAGWVAGSPEVWVVQTPILGATYIGNIANSPLGGNNILKVQDVSPNGLMTRFGTQFPVTNANTLFQFAFCGAFDGAHNCCEAGGLRIDLYNCTGSLIALPCANLTLTPGSGQCLGTGGYSLAPNNTTYWTNWQVKHIDLTPYIGQCIRMEITVADCTYGGHFGSLFFDARCGGQLIGSGLGGVGGNVPGAVSFCAGANQAVIAAPIGYVSYQWIAPGGFPIPAPMGTGPTYTVNNPLVGTVWTLQATSQSGCQYNITNTINFSQVNIAGIGSGPSCPGGASGTATVQGNGSGTGYNYVWLNSNSVTVGTNSTVTGLAPGTYSVVLTGLGAAGCGSAVTTVTIGTAPPGLINVYKPYCNNEAYLCGNSGSNFKWYNNLSLIAPPAGVQQCYTVTAPFNGAVYYLSYLSSFGCLDSIKFTLGQSAPGLMTFTQIPLICPGGNNGSAVVNLIPALGSPPGQNSYSVFSVGQTTPAYSASMSASSATAFPVTGLTAGTYSVSAFDGSCKYGGSFNVLALTYNYTLSPTATSLCPGGQAAAGITFSVPPAPFQYSYSWTPSTWLAGNTQQQTIISPLVAPGTVSTIVYTVVVTPAAANCPLTKTISMTAINPAPPVITAIQPTVCNTTIPFAVQATPGGGTYSAANANLLNSVTGILSPSFVPAVGINTLTYAYSIWTCVASSTLPYQVSQFNTSALTASVQNLCITNTPVNLMNIVQSTVNGTWAGNGVVGNQFYPATFSVTPTTPSNTGVYQIQYVCPSSPNPTTCPSITNLNISVTKTTTPYITPKPEFCNSWQPFTMTVTPAGGGWSGNGVSIGGIVTPSSYVNNGTYNMTYTVNDGPCLNSNTSLLTVSKFVPATLTGPIPYLCASNNPFNLMSIVQNATGTWTGAGVPQPAGTMIVPQQIGQTGFFTYTYKTPSVGNPTLCPDVSNLTTHVLVPPASTITTVGPYCNNGAPIQLTVSPNTGTWTASPFLSASGLFSPSLCPVGNNLVQYIIGTNTCNTVQNMGISIEAFVSAALSNSVPSQCRSNAPFNLGNITVNNSGTWAGPGVNAGNFDPAVVGTGQFVISYNTVSSPSGLCPDQSTLAVSVYSLAPPLVTQAGPFCSMSGPQQIEVTPAGGLFGGVNTSAVSPSGLFMPPSGVPGDNVINYSVTSGPCVAYAQTTIMVEAFVSADFAKYVDPLCRNAAGINMDSYVKNPGGIWAGNGISGNMFYPANANIGSSNTVTYTTYSSPNKLCKDTAAARIRVNELPDVNVTSNVYTGCAPLEVLLNMTSANNGNGTWNTGDGSDAIAGLNTTHVYSQPGTYTVVFNYADDIGCSGQATLATNIVVREMPEAAFDAPSEILISNPMVKLENKTEPITNYKYNWSIGNLYQIQDEVSPTVKFDKIGRYEIVLQATSIYNCVDKVSRTIEVKNDFQIYIPSSFTPNSDGLNDLFMPVFSPYGLDAKTYELEIFDRWGHSLFYTKEVTKGWDGTVLNKGAEELKEEVYIYRIKYKDMDGNVYNKMGHLSLMR